LILINIVLVVFPVLVLEIKGARYGLEDDDEHDSILIPQPTA
jgi:hypothetical protein